MNHYLYKNSSLVLSSILLLCIFIFQTTAVAKDGKFAITGAQIHTVSNQGVVENGTVLIEDGKIKEILNRVTVPSGYTEIDAKDKVVTPGFIGALTHLGLVEVSLSAGINDSRIQAHEVSSVGAAYDVSFAINPDSSLIDITRIEGFTSAATGLNSSGQLFDGQGALISLDNQFDSLLKPQAFVHVDVGHSGAGRTGESRAAMWVALMQSLEEATIANNMVLTPTVEWHGMITRADASVLTKVINGEIPLLVTAHRMSDILQALSLKTKYSDLDLVLVRASEAWRVADQIAKAQVAVILDPEYNLPGQFDRLGSTLENAKRLYQAGVSVSIGINTHNIRLAAQHAANAVANGLPHSAGIAALTINPAKIYGVEDQLGSLEPGKRADVVIWSGDPLEVTEAAEQVFIAGQPMSMESRQTKLRDRYLHNTSDKPVTYSK